MTMMIHIQKFEAAGTWPDLVLVVGCFCGCVMFSDSVNVPTGLGSLITGATALTCQ